MESTLAIIAAVVAISGLLAFTGAVKAATTVARFVFYIAVVVLVGFLLVSLFTGGG